MAQQKASSAFKLSLGNLRQRFLGISPEEASFERRRFWPGPARARLELIGAIFLRGYQLALDESEPLELVRQLNEVEAELTGFAFEGAAMGWDPLESTCRHASLSIL